MKLSRYYFMFAISLLLFCSCSKKTSPAAAPAAETATVKKARVAKVKLPTPKVITVNDLAAKKTVDGRYYYDLNSKRYWRNNRDGKYYLFNKSMYNDSDFTPQKTN